MSAGHHFIKVAKFTKRFQAAVHFWCEFEANPAPSKLDFDEALTLLSYAGTTPLCMIPGSLEIAREPFSDRIACRVPSGHFNHYIEQLKVACINEDFSRFYEAFDSLTSEANQYVNNLKRM